MHTWCRVCNNLGPDRRSILHHNSMSWSINLHELMRTVDGKCQMCDFLRHIIEAQPSKPALRGVLSYNTRPKVGSPFVLSLLDGTMALCIYSSSFEAISPLLPIPRSKARNTGLEMNNDESSFNFARTCLANCTAGINGHKSCEPQHLSPLPLRLLHIGAFPFKLIETQGEMGNYAALSYCWGREPEKQFKTLSSTLDKMKTGIFWEDLPPVFTDAITVLQELGIEMIWIDALCIVQDSTTDWDIESSRMAEYYAGACFTIAVDSCENPYVPFLGQQHPVYQPLRSRLGPDTVFCERIPTIADVFNNDINVLLKRGWTFQESALSKRILHYSACGLVWECRSMILPRHAMEYSALQDFYEPTEGLPRTFSQLLTLKDDEERHTAGLTNRWTLNWLSKWMNLVGDYSSRNLTLHNDKLPAFSGIASTVSRAVGWTYLAGQWKETLPVSLCWMAEKKQSGRSPPFPMPMPGSEGSPSWSWASINGEVKYLGHYWGSPGRKPPTVHARVIGSECALKGLNHFGQTKGGYVTLLGQITIVRLSFDPHHLKYFLGPITHSATRTSRANDSSIFGIDGLLEECDCKTPIFHGTKTLRRRPASVTYDPLELRNIFVELFLILRDSIGASLYLVLGRSPAVHGAHVRLGILRLVEEDASEFRAGELPEPIVVTII